MNRRIIALGLCISCSVLTMGCGLLANRIPELSHEEHDMVVEYATETLLKYDSKNGDKIGRQPEDYVIPKPEVVGEAEATATPEPILTLPVEDSSELGEVTVTDISSVPEESLSTIEEAMGVADSLQFEYTGYETVDVYPESTEAYFALTASEGCKLLIVKLKVSNITGESIRVNVPAENIRFKIVLNGEPKNALTTMLLNDLAFYAEDIEAGGSDEVMVLGEYPTEELEMIESLELIVKTKDGNTKVGLQ